MRAICGALIGVVVFAGLAWAEPHYIGTVKVRWLDDGPGMVLLNDFSFVDSRSVRWTAPRGAQIDGASIPKPFWSIIGTPFTGKYRDASVIHDFHTDAEVGYWRDVHRVFYEGMLTSGVPRRKAKTMYAAVFYFGKRWAFDGQPVHDCEAQDMMCLQDRRVEKAVPRFNEDAFARLERFIAETDPSLSEIESFDHPALDRIRAQDAERFTWAPGNAPERDQEGAELSSAKEADRLNRN